MRTQLQQDCLTKAQQIADEINGDLFYVPDEDVDNLLSQLTEDNVEEIASELAELAYQFNWNIMNREQLIEAYVDRILDNMSTKDLMRIVGDQLEENLSSYTDEELISEVEEYYPELIEGWLCMSKFLIGIVTGVILSTVGFNGIANLGNRAVNGIETFASSNQWRDPI